MARRLLRLAALQALCLQFGCGSDSTTRDEQLPDASMTVIGAAPGCGETRLERLPVTDRSHVAEVAYDELPPVGGDHLDCWADYGVHDEPVAPGNWVHNLEHGAIVVLHDCVDGCAAELAALAAFSAAQRVLMTPYDGLPTNFAAVAWGHRLTMDCLDMAALMTFYDDHFDMGLESVATGKPDGC